MACPHKDDLRLLVSLSGQGANGGARSGNSRVPADLKMDPLSTVDVEREIKEPVHTPGLPKLFRVLKFTGIRESGDSDDWARFDRVGEYSDPPLIIHNSLALTAKRMMIVSLPFSIPPDKEFCIVMFDQCQDFSYIMSWR
ncbi:hypothetical protein PoB_000430500 [Plakobranchus ocellatus]|uniref:Uncharacterized protein n=1 Tax=Plakobranchus ocellatus TaxID=259542 RepID=A0AAV3Y5Q5_9GAST|nr:hypothetical protein PoB_000430500 [Plakobranchus ocellatus]